MNKKKSYMGTMMVGADPEFFLLDKYGSLRCAGDYKFFSSTSSEIGRDGCSQIIEIRPPPVPINRIGLMADNIYDILLTIARWCQKTEHTIRAGANKGSYSIGGHIHFGSSDFIYDRYNSRINMDKLTWLLDSYFMPILDNFISKQELQRRINTNYGLLGNRRVQPHGMEYRTPFSFIISPFHTKAFFALASLIAYNYKKIPFNIKIHQQVVKFYNDLSDYEQYMNIYKTIKPIILKMMSYNSPNPKLNPYILTLFSLIEQARTCQDFSVLKNYSLLPPPEKTFIVNFSKDTYMNNIKVMIEPHIRNRSNGQIYIYGVGARNYTDVRGKGEENRVMYVSKNLPIIKDSMSSIKVSHYDPKENNVKGYKIGLSLGLRQEIAKYGFYPLFLTNYLNKLKLK